MKDDFFTASRAPVVERLAKIEGQSNFLSILAGIEAGTDTTEDMGALSFARARGCVPETLEAWVAQSVLFKLPLMSIVYRAVVTELKPADKDLPWVRGAIADAFLLLSRGECKTGGERAKQFHTRKADYLAIRSVAHGVMVEMCNKAEREFVRARRGEPASPGNRHTVGVEGLSVRGMAAGCYVATPLGTGEDGEDTGFDTRGLGVFDRLGWDERNIRPGPVLELHGDEAQAYCDAHPSQS